MEDRKQKNGMEAMWEPVSEPISGREFLERMKASVRDCDMVLIGVGEELGENYQELYETGEYGKWKDWGLETYAKAAWLHRASGAGTEGMGVRKRKIMRAFRSLQEIIGEKPYFFVTLNTDGYLYEAGFYQENIVAPCGSLRMLQCSSHILEPEEAAPLLARMEEEAGEGRKPGIPRCPVCHEPLTCNVVTCDHYLEDAYLPAWGAYTKWLSGTLHRRLCVLELGVGFAYPSVIRFPFEKTVYYNRKAILYRIHSKFPQIPEEIGDRSVSVRENVLDLLGDSNG